MPDFASGVVTFVFTDVEGSTRLLRTLGPERYAEVLNEHQRLLRESFRAAGGREIDTQGDAFFFAFDSATAAIAGASAGQFALTTHEWGDGAAPKVRMGVHTGQASLSDGRYHGVAVHRAARICSAAHGGQVLVSQTTHDLLADEELQRQGFVLRDLGPQRLKDLDRPLRLYQLHVKGLPERFPRLRTLDSGWRGRVRRRRTRVGIAAAALAVAATIAAALIASRPVPSRPVQVLANSVAVIDPKSGGIVADVPVGFAPHVVVAHAKRVWVLNVDDQTASAIDPRTLRVVRTMGLDSTPTDQWASGNTDWVAEAGAVQKLGPAPTDVKTIKLWKPSTSSDCGAFVTGSGGTVWVSQLRHFAEIDARTGAIRRRITLPSADPVAPTCYWVRYGNGGLYAFRDPDESIGPLDPRTGAFTPLLSKLIAFRGWDVGGGAIWTATQETDLQTGFPHGAITRFDLTSLQVTAKIVLGRDAGWLAVDPASGVWVLDPGALIVTHIDAQSGRVVKRIALHHYPCCVSAGHDRIWVSLTSP